MNFESLLGVGVLGEPRHSVIVVVVEYVPLNSELEKKIAWLTMMS